MQKGYSIVPLQVYLKNGRVKVEIALARGKKLYDKRDDMAKKEAAARHQRASVEGSHEIIEKEALWDRPADRSSRVLFCRIAFLKKWGKSASIR